MPPDEPLNRDRFYADAGDDDPSAGDASGGDASAEDALAGHNADEYELEPIDEQIVENQRRLAADHVRQAESAIDVDAVYREMHEGDGAAVPDLKLRFSVKHLLVGLTAVALLLGLLRMQFLNGSGFALLILATTAALAGVNMWFNRVEKRKQQRAMLRRERELAAARGESVEPLDDEENAEDNFEEFVREVIRSVRELRFDLRELASASVVAAAFLAMPSVIALDNAWSVMGLALIGGLACLAADLTPPRFVIAGWVFAMGGYLLLTVLTAVAQMLGFI